ncbi:uncharacterized protein LOC142766833 [Rhipicephalus microplus]|uniref:uncharacterized protein LOC142766833 n=1 Tax=Rhipicephalus microplus TaxID=6941 RepID=UPI003F6C6F72
MAVLRQKACPGGTRTRAIVRRPLPPLLGPLRRNRLREPCPNVALVDGCFQGCRGSIGSPIGEQGVPTTASSTCSKSSAHLGYASTTPHRGPKRTIYSPETTAVIERLKNDAQRQGVQRRTQGGGQGHLAAMASHVLRKSSLFGSHDGFRWASSEIGGRAPSTQPGRIHGNHEGSRSRSTTSTLASERRSRRGNVSRRRRQPCSVPLPTSRGKVHREGYAAL